MSVPGCIVSAPESDGVPMPERLWLDVPYAEKDTAKAAGARWDPDARRWYALRSMVYRRASNRCEACGAPRGRDRQRLEAHERWQYDENTYTQTLRRLIALCWSCHRATHIGFAEVTGTSTEASGQLRAVNGWS